MRVDKILLKEQSNTTRTLTTKHVNKKRVKMQERNARFARERLVGVQKDSSRMETDVTSKTQLKKQKRKQAAEAANRSRAKEIYEREQEMQLDPIRNRGTTIGGPITLNPV